MFLWRKAFGTSSSSSSQPTNPATAPQPPTTSSNPTDPSASLPNSNSNSNANAQPAPPPLTDPWRKRILMMGLRRAGKTSIREVVFHRLPPKQAFFVDTTQTVIKEDVEFWVPLQLWEIPGSLSLDALAPLGAHLSHFSSLIWVIDAADDYTESLRALLRTLISISTLTTTSTTSSSGHPGSGSGSGSAFASPAPLAIDVFAHKSDAWDDYYRQDAYRQIQDRTLSELEDHPSAAVQEMAERIQFHLTSVYDHTVFEAMSRVVQRFVPMVGFLEQTLNYWSQTLDIPKCFLFDVPSRLYISTDTSPVDAPSHEICCTYIENIEAVAGLFHMLERRKPNKVHTNGSANGGVKGKGRKVTYRATCSAKIAQDQTVAYWQISERLALVALVQTHMFDDHRGAIEMNVKSLRDAMLRLEAIEERKRHPPAPASSSTAGAGAGAVSRGAAGTGTTGQESLRSGTSSLRTPSVHSPSGGRGKSANGG